MKIVDFVDPEMIVPELVARTKPAVLAELAAHMAQRGLEREPLLRVLSERERLASTAVGEGVAIPHGKLASVAELRGCIGRSSAGVDFDSIDGKPTHLFFVLVAPESSTGIHLKALARISRLFKDPEFRARLRQAAGAEEMFEVVAEEDGKY